VRATDRGITILEVTVVLVLTSIVMMGIVGFYLNSQSTWIEASTQALTQRDATLAAERMSQWIRGAASAETPSPDILVLRDRDGFELQHFWLDASDSTLRHGTGDFGDDLPLVVSRVEAFQVSADTALVTVQSLVVAGPHGSRIEISTGAALYNRP
jgi:type II secretory pathway pseudopilin PulG